MKTKTMITAMAATALPAMSVLLGVAAGVMVCPLAKAAADRKVMADKITVSFFIFDQACVWPVLILRFAVQPLTSQSHGTSGRSSKRKTLLYSPVFSHIR